ncbi:MAG: PQQ-binding-like beta-propeller repeat protein [Streptosporangiaceae bacterium]
MRIPKIATRPIVLLAVPLLLAGVAAAPATGAAAAASRTRLTAPVASVSLSGGLLGVSALSASSAWAVGDAGTYPHTGALIVRWNGKSWKQVPSPHPAGSVLRHVVATSARNAWAVGYYGIGARTKTLILRWNGAGWKQVPSPSPGAFAALSGVAATSARNAWAVGYDGNASRFRTLILHWNGTAWRQVPSPSPGTLTSLSAVAATSAVNAWAVGASGTNNSQPGPLIERWNGRAWRRVPSPSPGSALSSVVAVSARSAWAVGLAGTGGGFLILRWNGKAWKRVPGPKPGGYLPYPSAVAATSASSAWVVGSTSTGKTLIERWNGAGWKRESSPSGSLSAVDAISGRNAWAVGETGGTHPRTLILRWDGTSWQGVAVASAATSRPVTASAPGSADAAAGSGARLWIKRYNGPGNGVDEAHSVAVSPAGKTVFVTGTSYGTGPAIGNYATVAYSATSGARLWIRRYNGAGNSGGVANKVIVSPSGKTVFVTGASYGTAASGYEDFATVAYNAATGAQLWVKLYNGTGNFNDEAYSMAVSPSGRTVFVTGQTYIANSGSPDYATVAYSAATGAQLWVRIYHGSGNEGFNAEAAAAVAVSPSGKTVYVTGQGTTSDSPDYATVAYSAATGAQEWVKLYRYPASSLCTATSLAVSPNGRTLFVTGYEGGPSGAGYSTIAYNAATGAQLWVKGYRPFKGGGADYARSIVVSPSGKTVYVTGGIYGGGGEGSEDYATLAYNAATGRQLWVKRYTGGDNEAYSMAVSPSGKRIYVTGASGPYYATVAYNAASGAQLWVNRYAGNGTVTLPGQALSVAVSRTAVFVTGYIVTAVGSIYDYVTIGYKG